MSKNLFTAVSVRTGAIILYVLIGLCCAFTVTAYATTTQQVSPQVGKPLQEARTLMDAKQWKGSLEKIREAAAVQNKTTEEEAVINEMMAYAMINLNDYTGAVAIYETMLSDNQFKKEERPKRILNIFQMYISLKNYPKAVQYGELYLKEAGPNIDVMRQISQAYYLQNDFVHAEEYATRLLMTARQQGKPLQEDWLKILLSTQYKQHKTSAVMDTLEVLLTNFPSQSYWSDMCKYVAAESTFTDRQSLIFLRLKKTVNVLTSQEYIEMAELAMAVTNPGEAKAVLEEGFEKGLLGVGTSKERDTKLLGLARTQAAEDVPGLAAIEQEALAKPTGEAPIKLGEAYLGHGQYAKAIALFDAGLAKGGVKFQDETVINKGIAYLKLNKPKEAIIAFRSVPESSKVGRLARLWVIYAGRIN